MYLQLTRLYVLFSTKIDIWAAKKFVYVDNSTQPTVQPLMLA